MRELWSITAVAFLGVAIGVAIAGYFGYAAVIGFCGLCAAINIPGAPSGGWGGGFGGGEIYPLVERDRLEPARGDVAAEDRHREDD